ncbi:MAG: substrate-binding domain-containing protein [Christensenellales bacterium]
MKKSLALLLVLCMFAAVLVGCTEAKPQATPAATQAPATQAPATAQPSATAIPNKAFKMGWSTDTLSSPFNANQDKTVKETIKKYPEIELFSTDGEANALKQVSDIEDLIAKGVDVIMCKPRDDSTLTEVMKKARAQGIYVVLIDRLLADETAYDCYVGNDHVQIGRNLATQLAEMTGGKANILFFEGTPGGTAYLERIKGFKEVMDAKYPNFKIVASQPCAAKRDEGKALMENWIQGFAGQFDACVCLTDEITMGVIQALDEHKITGVKVVSVNGAMEALNEIIAGRIQYTESTATGAHPGIEIAWMFLTGNGKLVPKKVIVPTVKVVGADIAKKYYDANLYMLAEWNPKDNPINLGLAAAYPAIAQYLVYR